MYNMKPKRAFSILIRALLLDSLSPCLAARPAQGTFLGDYVLPQPQPSHSAVESLS